MKPNTISKIIGSLCILIGIAFIVFYFPQIIDSESIQKEVDCFDKYGNKIIGQKCVKNGLSNSGVFYGSAFLIAFFLAVGLFLLTKDWENLGI